MPTRIGRISSRGTPKKTGFPTAKRINSSAALIACGTKERKSHGWTDLWGRSTLVKAGVFFTETREPFTRLEDRARNKVARVREYHKR
ncbi:hypothetical protein HO133_004431 [Letharia lupina]|uniref:Uncharacterized protein n=1 Tax=Letharia lupina TaxID=560253 RepID=A0A8H6FKB5_9LECA|nr:uncharacterized protein HO133_004431 [Letharia lupina]KAF6230092.1 hypothetical protein HO133_004431 [Letharia lupina]